MSLGYPSGQGYTGNYKEPVLGGSGKLLSRQQTASALSFGGKALGALGGFLGQMGYARMNAASAKAVKERMRWEESRLRLTERKILGSQAFLAARAGLTMTNTAKDVQDFTEQQIDLDSREIYRQGMAEYRAYKRAEKSSKISAGLSLVGAFL